MTETNPTVQFRTGRHNRQELVYVQTGPDAAEDSELRFVVAKGPIDGATLVQALNTPQALEILQRRRYATREEVADLLAPYLEGLDEEFPDGGYKWRDVALKTLDALGEMQAPVDALVQITVNEGV